MAIRVDPDGLAADATALADWQTAESTRGCEPAGADSVSVGVAAQLSAHSASLTALIKHGQQVRTEGGAVTLHTAASLRAADEAGADVIAGKTSTSGGVSAPATTASVSDPILPGIPAMPALPTSTGEAQAAALYTGPGAGSLRALADYLQSQVTTLDSVATQTTQTAASIDANWSDDVQQAGANAAKNGTWWSDIAGYARGLASAANEAANQFDRAVAATPSPQEFLDAHTQLTQAISANTASRGLLSSQVSTAAAHLAQLQGQATEAATAYHTAAVETLAAITKTPAPAPAIATSSSSSASATQSGTSNANKNASTTAGTGTSTSAGTGTSTTASTGTSSSVGSLGTLAESLLPMAAMLPMAGMAPMSALSGLGGMSRPDAATMASRFPGPRGVAGSAADAGADGLLPDDLGGTLPAGDSGGSAQAVSGEMAGPPISRPSPLSPPTVSAPTTSVGMPADQAGTSPAGVVGGSPMYPPMMGNPGAGQGLGQRDVHLYPDRRMVWRPAPNTEAVFGELQRERRSRVKRTAPEEGSDEG